MQSVQVDIQAAVDEKIREIIIDHGGSTIHAIKYLRNDVFQGGLSLRTSKEYVDGIKSKMPAIEPLEIPSYEQFLDEQGITYAGDTVRGQYERYVVDWLKEHYQAAAYQIFSINVAGCVFNVFQPRGESITLTQIHDYVEVMKPIVAWLIDGLCDAQQAEMHAQTTWLFKKY